MYRLIVDSEPTWADEPKSSMSTFTCCRLLVPVPILGRGTTGHGRQNQGKAMANHPCQLAKKITMNKVNSFNKVVADGETPRPECDSTTTGKEQDGESKATGSNEATGLKPKGCPVADRIGEHRLNLSCKKRLKVGTWNVRCMQSGKMDIIQREMKRLEISVMGLSETRWKGQGHFNWNGYRIIMSGQKEKGRNGVQSCVI